MRFLRLAAGFMVILGAALLASRTPGWAVSTPLTTHFTLNCQTTRICTDVAESEAAFGEDHYVGHDEPSLLFYSNTPGSGNNFTYHLVLPRDPPTLPQQNQTGGTGNFMLHPAFWFGVAMCDTQSFPEQLATCTPDSDSNIVDPAVSAAHPGTAFMEMQFYPPGWAPFPAGISCSATQWCGALNIDSLSQNPVTGQALNPTCQAQVGVEYVNFAFITKNGTTGGHGPANPVQSTLATYTPNAAVDLDMNSGDELVVAMQDTPQGFVVRITDRTTGQQGFMTASAANGFGQVSFDPTGTSCQNIPYDFHPMYATSSEQTRVPWAAHSYNVAFSDEIGHFEYCGDLNCATSDEGSPGHGDDANCFPASASLLVQVGGCTFTDNDFDGPEYFNNWPGTFANTVQDRNVHATPIMFSSPVFNQGQGVQNYDRIAFETDLPRIEASCNRSTGAGCTNPAAGTTFYPIFTARSGDPDFLQLPGAGCLWQEGGKFLPGTTNTFGGTSNAEYGPLLSLTYSAGAGSITRFNDFRSIPISNPCLVVPNSGAVQGGISMGTVVAGTPFSGVVLVFADQGCAPGQDQYSATITWGDGTTSAGVVAGPCDTLGTVSGTHTYPHAGSYPVSVTLTNLSRSGHTLTASATIVVTAAALTGSGQTFSATEGTTVFATLGNFSTANTALPAASYSASVDWGDGPPATAGSVATSSPAGNFQVRGSHKYAEAGSYPVTITITNTDGALLVLHTTASVADAALSGFGGFVSGTHGVALPATTQVATLRDANTSAPAGDFTAMIAWGDGSSPGTVTGSGGTYAVKGGHTYAAKGNYTITVTITDQDGAMVILTGSANIQ